MEQQQHIPVSTLHLFPKLDALLIDVLKSLSSEEWQHQTIARQWRVKDIAAHLLDGNLRTISFSRDHYFGEAAPAINSYSDLIHYLNGLNASWVKAARRLSPQVLIELLETTGPVFYHQLQQLPPFENALFAVAWAGHKESPNWFHIAREYTEKFIHQQQIREAVGRQALFTKELFYPFIDTLMYALPHTYRNVPAVAGTIITVKVLTEIGGEWSIIKLAEGWQFTSDITNTPATVVSIYPDTAWKLFSKGITAQQALLQVEIIGDQQLGLTALDMIAVMA